MLIEKNVDLTSLNTMNVQSVAEYYCKISSVHQLTEVIGFARENDLKLHVLGGGSNVILLPYISGVVVHMAILGRDILPVNEFVADFVVGAGENWHEFVQFTLTQGYPGLENLSLIPGTVGAAPVQNIGAYGVEVKDLLVDVTAIDLTSEKLSTLTLQSDQLDFDYRNSLFKKNPHRYVITSVRFRLDKRTTLKTSYGDILDRLGEGEVTAQSVSNAVIQARRSKLPDVSEIPNAGSFFKNPIVSHQKLNALQATFPQIVRYKVDEGHYKLAAGWLIEQAGWKGYRNEVVGIHDKQALVLINHNHGSSEDIVKLADQVKASVLEKYGVVLEVEPVSL